MDNLVDDNDNNFSSLDLYDDLITDEGLIRQDNYDELSRKYDDAVLKIKQLESEVDTLRKSESRLTEKCDTLERNISSLFLTARLELKRKDNIIQQNKFMREPRTQGRPTSDAIPRFNRGDKRNHREFPESGKSSVSITAGNGNTKRRLSSDDREEKVQKKRKFLDKTDKKKEDNATKCDLSGPDNCRQSAAKKILEKSKKDIQRRLSGGRSSIHLDTEHGEKRDRERFKRDKEDRCSEKELSKFKKNERHEKKQKNTMENENRGESKRKDKKHSESTLGKDHFTEDNVNKKSGSGISCDLREKLRLKRLRNEENSKNTNSLESNISEKIKSIVKISSPKDTNNRSRNKWIEDKSSQYAPMSKSCVSKEKNDELYRKADHLSPISKSRMDCEKQVTTNRKLQLVRKHDSDKLNSQSTGHQGTVTSSKLCADKTLHSDQSCPITSVKKTPSLDKLTSSQKIPPAQRKEVGGQIKSGETTLAYEFNTRSRHSSKGKQTERKKHEQDKASINTSQRKKVEVVKDLNEPDNQQTDVSFGNIKPFQNHGVNMDEKFANYKLEKKSGSSPKLEFDELKKTVKVDPEVSSSQAVEHQQNTFCNNVSTTECHNSVEDVRMSAKHVHAPLSPRNVKQNSEGLKDSRKVETEYNLSSPVQKRQEKPELKTKDLSVTKSEHVTPLPNGKKKDKLKEKVKGEILTPSKHRHLSQDNVNDSIIPSVSKSQVNVSPGSKENTSMCVGYVSDEKDDRSQTQLSKPEKFLNKPNTDVVQICTIQENLKDIETKKSVPRKDKLLDIFVSEKTKEKLNSKSNLDVNDMTISAIRQQHDHDYKFVKKEDYQENISESGGSVKELLRSQRPSGLTAEASEIGSEVPKSLIVVSHGTDELAPETMEIVKQDIESHRMEKLDVKSQEIQKPHPESQGKETIDIKVQGKVKQGSNRMEKPDSESQGMEKPDSESQGMEKPDSESQGMEKPDSESQGMEKPDSESQGVETLDSESQGVETLDSESQAVETLDSESLGMEKPDSDSKGVKKPDSELKGVKKQDIRSQEIKKLESEIQKVKDQDVEQQEMEKQDVVSHEIDKLYYEPQGIVKLDSEPQGMDIPGSEQQEIETLDSEMQEVERQDMKTQQIENLESESKRMEKKDVNQGMEKLDSDPQGIEKLDSDPQGIEKLDSETRGIEKLDSKSQVIESLDSESDGVEILDPGSQRVEKLESEPQEIEILDVESFGVEKLDFERQGGRKLDTELLETEKLLDTEICEMGKIDTCALQTDKLDSQNNRMDKREIDNKESLFSINEECYRIPLETKESPGKSSKGQLILNDVGKDRLLNTDNDLNKDKDVVDDTAAMRKRSISSVQSDSTLESDLELSSDSESEEMSDEVQANSSCEENQNRDSETYSSDTKRSVSNPDKVHLDLNNSVVSYTSESGSDRDEEYSEGGSQSDVTDIETGENSSKPDVSLTPKQIISGEVIQRREQSKLEIFKPKQADLLQTTDRNNDNEDLDYECESDSSSLSSEQGDEKSGIDREHMHKIGEKLTEDDLQDELMLCVSPSESMEFDTLENIEETIDKNVKGKRFISPKKTLLYSRSEQEDDQKLSSKQNVHRSPVATEMSKNQGNVHRLNRRKPSNDFMPSRENDNVVHDVKRKSESYSKGVGDEIILDSHQCFDEERLKEKERKSEVSAKIKYERRDKNRLPDNERISKKKEREKTSKDRHDDIDRICKGRHSDEERMEKYRHRDRDKILKDRHSDKERTCKDRHSSKEKTCKDSDEERVQKNHRDKDRTSKDRHSDMDRTCKDRQRDKARTSKDRHKKRTCKDPRSVKERTAKDPHSDKERTYKKCHNDVERIRKDRHRDIDRTCKDRHRERERLSTDRYGKKERKYKDRHGNTERISNDGRHCMERSSRNHPIDTEKTFTDRHNDLEKISKGRHSNTENTFKYCHSDMEQPCTDRHREAVRLCKDHHHDRYRETSSKEHLSDHMSDKESINKHKELRFKEQLNVKDRTFKVQMKPKYDSPKIVRTVTSETVFSAEGSHIQMDTMELYDDHKQEGVNNRLSQSVDSTVYLPDIKGTDNVTICHTDTVDNTTICHTVSSVHGYPNTQSRDRPNQTMANKRSSVLSETCQSTIVNITRTDSDDEDIEVRVTDSSNNSSEGFLSDVSEPEKCARVRTWQEVAKVFRENVDNIYVEEIEQEVEEKSDSNDCSSDSENNSSEDDNESDDSCYAIDTSDTFELCKTSDMFSSGVGDNCESSRDIIPENASNNQDPRLHSLPETYTDNASDNFSDCLGDRFHDFPVSLPGKSIVKEESLEEGEILTDSEEKEPNNEKSRKPGEMITSPGKNVIKADKQGSQQLSDESYHHRNRMDKCSERPLISPRPSPRKGRSQRDEMYRRKHLQTAVKVLQNRSRDRRSHKVTGKSPLTVRTYEDNRDINRANLENQNKPTGGLEDTLADRKRKRSGSCEQGSKIKHVSPRRS
ncbi:uncharacterized protein LOC132563635 [Ylistrum balloti]|uniref:uncharacterized protein LOC132563635 n=1 Tax=Ylistrum balloti TaxID=509963 RepID=UPI0029059198|nr:uncharacterized protein LOC132563635 [Ylistrum balloti]